MSPRRTLGALLLAALALLAGLLAVPPAAQAAGPPVTTPDQVSVYQGNFVAVYPVSNDHDPDNEQVAICRLGTERNKGIDVSFYGDEVDFGVTEKAKPGIYTYTYYACDYQSLVPGTITLTVQKLPKIKIAKTGPGKLKVKNPFPFRIRFFYGSFREDSPDGQLRIAAGAATTIKVSRTQIDWLCDAKKGSVYCGSGQVKGIKVDAVGRETAARLASGWPALAARG